MSERESMETKDINTTGLVQFKKAIVNPFDDGKDVLRCEYKDGCFMYYSFQKEQSTFGDVLVKPFMTFLADNGKGIACEWEPAYGPFTRWRECDAEWKGENCFGRKVGVRRHWHFEYVEDECGNWSQLAVDNTGIKHYLLSHDIDGVFDILMGWAR